MDEKAVAKGLFKKLSALRATLSDDEQALLDKMLEGEYDVEAHLRIQPAADERRITKGADERRITKGADERRITKGADEAEAHLRIQPAADDRWPCPEADEAVAHKKAPPAADAKAAFRVIYNPDDETYLVE